MSNNNYTSDRDFHGLLLLLAAAFGDIEELDMLLLLRGGATTLDVDYNEPLVGFGCCCCFAAKQRHVILSTIVASASELDKFGTCARLQTLIRWMRGGGGNDDRRWSAIVWASAFGQIAAVERLLVHTQRHVEEALLVAIAHGNDAIVLLLLARVPAALLLQANRFWNEAVQCDNGVALEMMLTTSLPAIGRVLQFIPYCVNRESVECVAVLSNTLLNHDELESVDSVQLTAVLSRLYEFAAKRGGVVMLSSIYDCATRRHIALNHVVALERAVNAANIAVCRYLMHNVEGIVRVAPLNSCHTIIASDMLADDDYFPMGGKDNFNFRAPRVDNGDDGEFAFPVMRMCLENDADLCRDREVRSLLLRYGDAELVALLLSQAPLAIDEFSNLKHSNLGVRRLCLSNHDMTMMSRDVLETALRTVETAKLVLENLGVDLAPFANAIMPLALQDRRVLALLLSLARNDVDLTTNDHWVLRHVVSERHSEMAVKLLDYYRRTHREALLRDINPDVTLLIEILHGDGLPTTLLKGLDPVDRRRQIFFMRAAVQRNRLDIVRWMLTKTEFDSIVTALALEAVECGGGEHGVEMMDLLLRDTRVQFERRFIVAALCYAMQLTCSVYGWAKITQIGNIRAIESGNDDDDDDNNKPSKNSHESILGVIRVIGQVVKQRCAELWPEFIKWCEVMAVNANNVHVLHFLYNEHVAVANQEACACTAKMMCVALLQCGLDTANVVMKQYAVAVGCKVALLKHAISENRVALADLLLSSDQSVRAISGSLCTSQLYHAAAHGRDRMVDLLLRHGADPTTTTTTNNNNAAICVAAQSGHAQVVRRLVGDRRVRVTDDALFAAYWCWGGKLQRATNAAMNDGEVSLWLMQRRVIIDICRAMRPLMKGCGGVYAMLDIIDCLPFMKKVRKVSKVTLIARIFEGAAAWTNTLALTAKKSCRQL